MISKAHFRSINLPHSSDWFNVIPTNFDLRLSNEAFKFVVKLRLNMKLNNLSELVC